MVMGFYGGLLMANARNSFFKAKKAAKYVSMPQRGQKFSRGHKTKPQGKYRRYVSDGEVIKKAPTKKSNVYDGKGSDTQQTFTIPPPPNLAHDSPKGNNTTKNKETSFKAF
jgi:hypothetical protein